MSLYLCEYRTKVSTAANRSGSQWNCGIVNWGMLWGWRRGRRWKEGGWEVRSLLFRSCHQTHWGDPVRILLSQCVTKNKTFIIFIIYHWWQVSTYANAAAILKTGNWKSRLPPPLLVILPLKMYAPKECRLIEVTFCRAWPSAPRRPPRPSPIPSPAASSASGCNLSKAVW